MAADPPDSHLIRRTLAGDREAFAVLYDRYARLVRAVARDDDQVQEAFLRAYRNLRTLRHADGFAPWLVGIARQVVREAWRKRPSERLTREPPARPEPSADDADEAAHVRALVDRLPADQRDAIRLFFLLDRDADETARLLGRSRSGTYRLVSRGVATLAGWLAEKEVPR